MRNFAVLLALSVPSGLAAFSVGHCETHASPTAVTSAESNTENRKLRRVEVGDTKPAHQCGAFYLAGQPAKEDLAKWKARGVRTVINLRMPQETDWNERAAVEALGMKYVSVPFAGPDTLSHKKIRDALHALRTGRFSDQSNGDALPNKNKNAKPQPILLHCASSNRVGAIWYAHRILHDDWEPEAALKEAKTVGLRTMGYLEPVEAYIERVNAK